jgi:hypothetical protein
MDDMDHMITELIKRRHDRVPPYPINSIVDVIDEAPSILVGAIINDNTVSVINATINEYHIDMIDDDSFTRLVVIAHTIDWYLRVVNALGHSNATHRC